MKGFLRKESLKKCEPISNFGLDQAQVELGNSKSKEDCQNARYWEEKTPNENVFVSYNQSHCLYDLDRHVTLVQNPNQILIIYSSCGPNGNGKADEQQNNNGGKDEERENSSQINGILSVIGVGILIVFGFLILALIIIVVMVKRRRAKYNDKDVEEKNDMYGGNDPEEYYELGKNTEIKDRNEYYYAK